MLISYSMHFHATTVYRVSGRADSEDAPDKVMKTPE